MWPSRLDSRLVIRASWLRLWALIVVMHSVHGPGSGLRVSGNPGIGKSWFLRFLIFMAMKSGWTVILDSVMDSVLYIFEPGTTPRVRLRGTYGARTFDACRNPKTLYLHDPSSGSMVREPDELPAFTVTAPSDARKHAKQFLKNVNSSATAVRLKAFMPPWTMIEASAYAKAFPPSNLEVFKSSFDKFGGTIRMVRLREVAVGSALKQLDHAIKELNWEELFAAVGSKAGEDDGSSQVLQCVPVTRSLMDIEMRFASEYVAEGVSAALTTGAKDRSLEFIHMTESTPEAASLRDFLLERAAHRILCGGGTFRAVWHRTFGTQYLRCHLI